MNEVCWFTGYALIMCILIKDCHAGHQQRRSQSAATKQKHHEFFSGSSHLETLSWAVKLNFDATLYTKQELDMVADLVAIEVGLDNLGQIGEFRGHYYMVHKFHGDTTKHITDSYHYFNRSLDVGMSTLKDSYLEEDSGELTGWEGDDLDSGGNAMNLTERDWGNVKQSIHMKLDNHQYVLWHMQQLVRSRQKRSLAHTHRRQRADTLVPGFNDPAFSRQWHLINFLRPTSDINVTGIWHHGYTGKGITTAVIDDGLEWTNPDLKANYCPEGSWDLNSDDSDPMPHGEKEKNHHGTRCAGEIAAVANNNKCGVGVAYNAKVAGIRVLDGPMTDSLEATAFMKGYTINDVYSCSWGPDDDGKTVDGPHFLATQALRLGVDYGRNGYGAIYVVASGNGGLQGDNCNYDGYANSIYTLTIGAVDEYKKMPFYAEECASMLAVTFSSGNGQYERSIVTTDWMKDGGTGCTSGHTGTSAAAPIAAGIIALMLEARPCLTWRDVQYIIVMAAEKVDVDIAHWYENAAGLHHSHKHGFGLMNAWKIVNAARAWEPIPWMTVYVSDDTEVNAPIPGRTHPLRLTIPVGEEELEGYQLSTMEYVQTVVTIDHVRRGDVEIRLLCPSGTESLIGATRVHDDSKEGFQEWMFSTVRCWGEEPMGDWTLIVTDKGSNSYSRGEVVKWKLKLFGSPLTPSQVQRLHRLVRQAEDGRFLSRNISLPCPPPPLRNQMVQPLSERILKIITLCSIFCLVMGVYQSMEYAFCFDDEKKEQYKMMALVKRARTITDEVDTPVCSETSCLLSANVIALADLTESGCSDPSLVTNSLEADHDAIPGPSSQLSRPAHCAPSLDDSRYSERSLLLKHPDAGL